MQEKGEQEVINELRMALDAIDRIIEVYKTELKEGRFKPRHGDRWERTVEKQIVEVAIIELQQLNEERSLEEMCKLIDEMEEFAEKARLVDA